MKIIKELAKRIKEELHDAEWYAKKAMEHKATAPDVAEAYHRLAKEEMAHANILHERVVMTIRKVPADKEVPAAMREIWAWQHAEIVEEEAEVRRLIEMYTNMP